MKVSTILLFPCDNVTVEFKVFITSPLNLTVYFILTDAEVFLLVILEVTLVLTKPVCKSSFKVSIYTARLR